MADKDKRTPEEIAEDLRLIQQSSAEAVAEIEADIREHGHPLERPDATLTRIQSVGPADSKMVFNLRLAASTLTGLGETARGKGMSASALARLYIERGLESEKSGDLYDRVEQVEREIAELRETQAAYQTARQGG